jgi:diaminopimelate decarboxylase
MNIDVIREHITFPILKKGDIVVISRIGAYNMTQWMQFITLRPKVVIIAADGKTHVIRNNETNEMFDQIEQMPSYLKDFKL